MGSLVFGWNSYRNAQKIRKAKPSHNEINPNPPRIIRFTLKHKRNIIFPSLAASWEALIPMGFTSKGIPKGNGIKAYPHISMCCMSQNVMFKAFRGF